MGSADFPAARKRENRGFSVASERMPSVASVHCATTAVLFNKSSPTRNWGSLRSREDLTVVKVVEVQ